MRLSIFLMLLFSVSYTYSQESEIVLDSDTIKFSILRDGQYDGQSLYKFPIQPDIDQSPYTLGGKDIEFVFYGLEDTVSFRHTAYPVAQAFPFKVKSPNHEIDMKVGFHSVTAELSDTYIDEVRSKVVYEIPEVFELANIILGLLDDSFEGANQNTESDYYSEVLKFFGAHRDHEIFNRLNTEGLDEKEIGDIYYDFRDNSYGYVFDESGRIVHGNQYFYLHGYNKDTHKNTFVDLLPLVQDFADKSDFRSFFDKQQDFYSRLASREPEFLKTKDIWQWLENEFPLLKIHAYKIVMSPVIGGSHSTQKFHQRNARKNTLFSECIMFMNASDLKVQERFDSFDEKVASISGNLFTELDHNYINPFTGKYYKEISSAFKDRSQWVTEDKAKFYSSEHSIYQEYITHALYSIWAYDTFSPDVAAKAVAKRVDLNKNRRGFYRFDQFNEMLMALEEEHNDKTIMELLPQIIQWCENID